MRALLFVGTLALLLCGAMFQLALAAGVVELDDGTYVLKNELPLVKQELGVEVSDEAAAYPGAWRKALRTGEDVPVETTVERRPKEGLSGMLVLEEVTRAIKTVVYDRAAGTVELLNQTTVLESSMVLSPALFWVATMVLVFVSHLLVRAGRPNAALVLVLVSVLPISAAAAFTLTVVTDGAASVAFGLAATAAVGGVAATVVFLGSGEVHRHSVMSGVSVAFSAMAMSALWW